MKNDLYRGIPAKSPNSQYDTQCKRVLGNKKILAWILKYTSSEFATFTIEEIVPGVPDRRVEYDKISVILICLNNKMASQTKMTEMLNILLSPTLPKEEKVELLENRFHLHMDDEFGKELNIMCNLSEYVEELGAESF